MLGLLHLQNKLVDITRFFCLKFLNYHTRMSLSIEPFPYLEDDMGYHINMGKFLVVHYAGLSSHEGGYSVDQLDNLPDDITQHLQQRHSRLKSQGRFKDPPGSDVQEWEDVSSNLEV
ncbi:hypothetical protein T440DRAFT_522588 [Plenodomus tracheiphilus IPT5]|uniref:Uncharacterized protein n=1 Tax=Plenodomus tracheiphilus IPT5 TaxID=1408161 RepID=A0A6A7ATJ9_9PLEO|nr:hypothetical protein T440DRAFT_522588 [Plenodomus tracheiphilus IPT5]